MISKIIHQTAKEKQLTWEENQLVNHIKKALKEIPSSILKKKCILPISHINFRIGKAILASEPNHAFGLNLLNDIFNDKELLRLKECRVEGMTDPIKVTNFYRKHKEKYNALYLANQFSIPS